MNTFYMIRFFKYPFILLFMVKQTRSQNAKNIDKNDTLENKLEYIGIFSNYHIQYINLLNLLKEMIIKLPNFNTLSPQEMMCLIQIYDTKQKNSSSDTGLKSLAKRTNNIADHLLFQLNNLARKNLVTIQLHAIALTHDGEYIIREIANQIDIKSMNTIKSSLHDIGQSLAIMQKAVL